jgi:ribosome-binding protein aMBF1 (putative translation factor)
MSKWINQLIKKKSKYLNLCHICSENQLPEEPAIIRLQVQEGIAEVLVCDECADFFDKSAEVLLKRGRDTSDERI